jgi:hypothetical protein
MKLKAFLLALAVAGAGSSLALAEGGPSTETTTTATTTSTTEHHGKGDCRRTVFRGTIAAVGASSFTVNVTKGEHGGSGVTTSTMTVTVTPDTWVSWVGKGSMSGPNVGDSVRVWGKTCGDGGTFTAVWVQASKPRPHGPHGDKPAENHTK